MHAELDALALLVPALMLSVTVTLTLLPILMLTLLVALVSMPMLVFMFCVETVLGVLMITAEDMAEFGLPTLVVVEPDPLVGRPGVYVTVISADERSDVLMPLVDVEAVDNPPDGVGGLVELLTVENVELGELGFGLGIGLRFGLAELGTAAL